VFSETVAIKIQQSVPMRILVLSQVRELCGLLRMAVTQAFGEIVINAGIFLFLGDGQGQNFPFGETVK